MNCKYHPTSHAQWHCKSCEVPFCLHCADIDDKSIAAKCLLCRGDLGTYGISKKITPFWSRLGEFYKYPLHTNVKSFFIAFAIAAFIYALVTSFIPIFLLKVLARLAVLSLLFSYAFKALSFSGRGKFTPPTYDEGISFNDDGMTSKFLWMFIGLFLFGLSLNQIIGGYSLLIYMAVVMFCLPAMTIALAMHKDLGHAINPLAIASTVRGIGGPYLILAGLSLVINYSMLEGEAYIQFWLPELLATVIGLMLTAYLTIVMFSMYGYAAYQYHAELGYGMDAEVLLENSTDDKSVQKRRLHHSDVYIQEGRYDDAQDLLYEAAKTGERPEVALAKIVQLNIARANPLGAIKAAQEYYMNPNLKDTASDAYQVYKKMLAFEPRFKPMSANARAVLVSQMRGKSVHEDVSRLVSDAREKLADDKDLGKLYLAYANYQVNSLNDDASAVKTLTFAIEHYPQGEHRLEAQQLLATCQAVLKGNS